MRDPKKILRKIKDAGFIFRQIADSAGESRQNIEIGLTRVNRKAYLAKVKKGLFISINRGLRIVDEIDEEIRRGE